MRIRVFVRMTQPDATVEPSPGAFQSLERLRRLEKLLDRQFTVAGIGFGIDSVIGLVPVVGDLITGAMGFYLIHRARRYGVPKLTLARMYANWGIDVCIGAIPIVGDVFDLLFKSNTKNVRLLIAHLEKQERRVAETTRSRGAAAARRPPAPSRL